MNLILLSVLLIGIVEAGWLKNVFENFGYKNEKNYLGTTSKSPALTFSLGEVNLSPVAESFNMLTDNDENDPRCKHIRPEWNLIKKGLYTRWFPNAEELSPPPLSSLFQFTCPNNGRLDKEGFVIPVEINEHLVFMKPEKKGTNYIHLSENLLDLIQNPIIPNSANWFSSILSRYQSGSKIPILESIIEIYTLSVEKYELSPSQFMKVGEKVKDSYFNCGDEDVLCMYNFVSRYGSHVYRSATFGGKLSIAFQKPGRNLNYRGNLSKWKSTLSDFLELNSEQDLSQQIYFEGGQNNVSQTPDQWVSSISNAIVIIEPSKTLPICLFMDPPLQRKGLKASCLNVIEGFERRFKARQFGLAISGFTGHEGIRNSLKALIQDESTRIFPSQNNLELIEEILKKNNILDRFHVSCRIRNDEGNFSTNLKIDKQNVSPCYKKYMNFTEAAYSHIDYKYPIIPGICVSTQFTNFQNCTVYNPVLPTGGSIKMYTEKDCYGIPTSFPILQGFQELENYASYKFN